MSLKKLKSVYSYSDFREYLKDFYKLRIMEKADYSHRAMAKELGFSSPNYIKLVMDGKRNIGLKALDKLSEGLKLREKEKEYFSSLVFFCQAKNSIEKKFYFGQLASFKPSVKKSALTPNEYRYYNDWYNCAVRELVVREEIPVQAKNIASKIVPNLTVKQVEKSIELLKDLGLISGNSEQGYKLESQFIATDKEVTSLGIRNFHGTMMDLGKASMDRFAGKDREISSLTLCISETCKKKIKSKIHEWQNEILEMVKEDQGSNRVHQLNFQFFPLSGTEGES